MQFDRTQEVSTKYRLEISTDDIEAMIREAVDKALGRPKNTQYDFNWYLGQWPSLTMSISHSADKPATNADQWPTRLANIFPEQ